jgi:transketolase
MGTAKEAYVLADADGGQLDVILIGTGNEMSFCADAYEQLTPEGINARMVSKPSWEFFGHQSQEYRDSVLLPSVIARVSVEQVSNLGWARCVSLIGYSIGEETFQVFVPLKALQQKFGFTVDHFAAKTNNQLILIKRWVALNQKNNQKTRGQLL